MRLDMAVDPPPDLAIEADVTSQTTLEAYTAIAVPEVWSYDRGKLTIYRLQGNEYQAAKNSLVFPNLAITDWIPQLINQAFEVGTSTLLRNLRPQLATGEIEA